MLEGGAFGAHAVVDGGAVVADFGAEFGAGGFEEVGGLVRTGALVGVFRFGLGRFACRGVCFCKTVRIAHHFGVSFAHNPVSCQIHVLRQYQPHQLRNPHALFLCEPTLL